MSTGAIAHIRRAAVVLSCAAVLLAPIDALAAPGPAAATSSVVPPAGHLTPMALGPGQPSANHAVFAQPFRTLDPGALRAAKLRAAAIASRGSRGPRKPAATVTPLSSFFNNLNSPGLSDLMVAPPDSTGAVGPNNYIEMVNQNIGVYDRGLNQLSTTDNGSFMGTGSGTSVSDPQIQWDGRAGRWLYAGLGVATGNNLLLFGWSKTSNPSDLVNGWCRFGIFRANLLDDYPKLGHDDNFISIGVNVYDDSQAFKFITANVFAIPKPTGGDTSCVSGSATYFASAAGVLHDADGSVAFTPVPANTADASAAGYIVAAHSPVDGVGSSAPMIMVWHLASNGGLPVLVADGDVGVSQFDVPAPVPQPGTSYTLDSLDARLTQAVAVNDPGAGGAKGIWTQHTVASPSGRSIVRWYEILGGATPTRRQQGDISSSTDFVFNGAISPSIGGDSAAIFYNRGGASTLPILGAQTRSASTPLNGMDAGELVIGQSSSNDLDFTCGYYGPTTPCRWGDYAGASPDSANPGVVWGSSQVTGPCYIFCGLFAQWQTRNFAVVASTAPPPPPPVPPGPPTLNTATAGNASVSLGWSAPSSDGGAQITDYAVYRSTAPGGEVFRANSGGALTFNDTGLTNGTTYYYKVAAINSAGTGTLSNERSGTPAAPPPPADFSLSVTPSSRTVSRGATTTYSVTVVPANGFTGTVTFGSSISPAASGLTMSFSPTTVTGSGPSTLTVTTARRTAKHTYTITITATSGSLVHTATVTLIVH